MAPFLGLRHQPSVYPSARNGCMRGASSCITTNQPHKIEDNRMTDDGLASDSSVSTRIHDFPNFHNPKVECDNNGNLMKFERHRLDSYASWPANAPIEAKKLAKAGFFYTGNEFTVKCFSCKRTIDEWNFGDQAIQKHTILSPNCDFVLNKSDNVPVFAQRATLYTSISSQAEESLQSTNSTFPSTNPTFPSTNPSFSSTNSTFSSINSALPSTSRPQNLRIPFSISSASASGSDRSDEKTWESFGNFLSEAERLKTFRGWPSKVVKPEDLARNGFFYLKDEDKVQCFFCRGVVGQWEDGDNPAIEHRKHFRSCPFICGYNVRNIPLRRTSDDEGIEVLRSPTDENWGGDVTGKYNYEMDVFSKPEKGRMTPLKLSRLGINEHTAPRHPNYATYENRLKTYQTWPTAIPMMPKALAEAGFYYAGVSDHVRCFCCDGGLRNWEVNDDPWVEHARWFGKCCFLNLMKGHEFVEEAMMRHPPILPAQPGPSSEIQLEDPILVHMKSSIVKAAMETGVDQNIIRQVIAKKIELTGTPYDDANALTEACMDFPYCENTSSQSKVITPINDSMPSTSFACEENFRSKSLPVKSMDSLKSFTQSGDMSVEDENRQLKEMRLCKICMDEEIGVVFLPCGHLICCPKCAPSLKDCPVCRKEIRGTVRTFLS
uniref:RING-type domain-containing protein n=1 Tax=Strigamia maritima TaxID=126957 RepID=T1JFM1_STRMM